MSGGPPTTLDGPLAVATDGVAKRYGREEALRDLALQVPDGAVYLLVGPNGAGKSTTLRLLLDLVRADAGTARVLGLDPRTHGATIRANAGYVPDRHDWGIGWLRVGRLLRHHARYFPTWDDAYARHLARLFELPLERRLATLSKGQARRVHLLLALAHRPPLLLLDEPTDGLDPVMRDELLGVLSDHLAAAPTTVVLSTHHVAEVEPLADHVGVLRGGTLRAQATTDALRRELRRYRAEVPDGWGGVPTLNGAVVRREGAGREVRWTVWGEEAEVVRHLTTAGATVRDAAQLSLHEATLALLANREDGR